MTPGTSPAPPAPLRVGVVGTAHWARTVHAAGAVAAEQADLVALWGRTPEKVAPVAERYGVTAADSFDALLEQVDVVTFAVPPQVQPELAARAARPGSTCCWRSPWPRRSRRPTRSRRRSRRAAAGLQSSSPAATCPRSSSACTRSRRSPGARPGWCGTPTPPPRTPPTATRCGAPSRWRRCGTSRRTCSPTSSRSSAPSRRSPRAGAPTAWSCVRSTRAARTPTSPSRCAAPTTSRTYACCAPTAPRCR
ncbi:Gfo/Idh/MocA family oxidoreductase [Nocardioides sp. Y6]|uniref:Gfo/Idh/MocA family oxidoreductase n=1 Tax=Nocardioides malaquae TaxID=2773426 RepID=A0ABR9RQN5_9ACTN|nr:Gfo/Idh/MocA family oxidoreductase [Nocardioides malaquae]